ncbi:MAG: UvrD-helicase domain-containing protein, partial [Verrucomicrobiota bacterium]
IELTTLILDSLDRCFQNPYAQPADYLALVAFTAKNLTADTAKRGSGTPTHPFFDDAQTLSDAWDDYLLALQLEFLHSAPQELQKRKLQRNVLSFDDLLVHLLSALQGPSGPALIAATRSRFSAALVDEFQDTDPTQAAIFQTLFQNDGRLWLIGDPKQAIYAFRGADVFSYLNAVEQAQFHYSLSSNQRSITPLVEAVNHFFKAGSPSFVVPGINFLNSTPAGRQDPNALDNSPPFKFWLCSHEKPLSKTKATPQINLAVTNAIVSQLQSNATIAGRPLAPSDFAVLTKTNYEAKELHAKLSAAGLPAIVMGSASVLQSEEARELLAILHAISNPTREEFLRAALATITLGYNSPSIHDLSSNLPKWESILADFSKHHQDWLKHGFAPAFRRFLITWQVRPRLLAFFDGERRLTNLLHLAELLHEAAISQDLGPASLPTWLATQMDPQTKTTDAHEQRLESDEAAVKVVTVHKSKGLEFNLVWVPFSWTNADPRKNAPVVFHNPQNTLTLDLGSPDLEAHHAILAQELLAEDARLLYVALTRAKLQCNFIWGRFYQSEVSAANWILHPPSPNPASAVVDLKTHKLDDATFRSQISHLVDSHPTAFSATDLPPVTDPLQRWTPPPTTNLPKEARTFTGSISRDWRISSFSSLISHTHPDLPDYDRPTTAKAPANANPKESGIHAFPRGTRAGTCLHAIFEKLDFTDDSQINPLVEAQLQIAGFSSPANLQAVSHTVRQTLATELLPGLRLQQIPKSQRLTEAEFHLPVGNLTPAHLKDLLGEDLDFYTFKGFLKGFIDLIFQHDGRFYLLDWKSNHLGSSSDHYTPEVMEAEMRKHHYHLQFHLYTVALHRYLKLRIPNYLPENHFGGVFYLFLRGINPAQPSLGVFHKRPDPQLIARLETLFPTSIPHAQ